MKIVAAAFAVTATAVGGEAGGGPAKEVKGQVETQTGTEDGRLSALKALLKAGKYSETESRARALLTTVEAATGEGSVEDAGVLDVLVESLWRGGKAKAPETRELAQRALSIKEKAFGPEHPDVATSLNGLASVAYSTGDYAGARPLLERALAIREKALGPDHPDVAQSLNGLASVAYSAGDYAGARPLFERALAIREKALGPDHPDVAQSLNSLANLFRVTGDVTAARPLFERALAIRETALGPDHIEVARSLNNLANLLFDIGDYAAARPLFERAQAIKEKALGPDHPDVAAGLNNLAVLLRTIGEYPTARALYERALAIQEKALGPDHPELARSLRNLAVLLFDIGDHDDVRPLLERALAINEKAFGPDHPNVAASLNDLADLLRRVTGDYTAARPMLERALAINEKALGPDHPNVAASLSLLASLLRDNIGDYAAARPLYERALAIREKVLGPNHPDTAWTLNDLANLLRLTGEFAAARPMFERALAIHEKAFGPNHPDTAWSLSDLANLLRLSGDYAAARPMYERALAIQEKALGPDHPTVAHTLNGLARVLLETGDYAAARPMYERALAIWEKVHDPDNPGMADTLNDLALMLLATGDFAAARPMYERALAIAEKARGPSHPALAWSLSDLATLLRVTGDYAAARPMYERALAIHEKAFGPDHPAVARSLGDLAYLLRVTGEFAAARLLYERALAIDEKAFGPDNPEVANTLNGLARVLLDSGEFAAARPMYERALAIREKAHDLDTSGMSDTLNDLGWMLLATGDYAAARPILEHALAIREKAFGSDRLPVAWSLTDLATLLRDTGDYAAARPIYERALAITEKALGPNHPDTAWSLNLLATLRATQGDTTGGLDLALEAERIGRDHLRLTGRVLSEEQALRYAAVRRSGVDLVLTLASRPLDGASRRRTLDALVRSRAVVLDEMAARHRAVSSAKDPEVARLAAALSSTRVRLANLVVRGLGKDEPELYRKLLDDARREKEEAERALAGASGAFAREMARSRLGLEEVAKSLSDGEALVALAKYKKIDITPNAKTKAPVPSYLAFVLRSGDRDPVVVDLGPAAAIEDLVSRWKREASGGVLLTGGAFEQAEASYREAGAALRRKLWDPLAPAFGDAGRVFVVPDGSLNLINIAALPVDGGGYLVEHGPLIHYLSAERDLVPAAERTRSEGLLALGGPAYDATQMFGALAPKSKTPKDAHTASPTVAGVLQPSSSPGGAPVKQGASAAAPLIPAPGAPIAAAEKSPIQVASTATYRGPRSACSDFASLRFEPLPATAKETRQIVRLWEKHGKDPHVLRTSTTGEAKLPTVLHLRDTAATETALKQSAPGRRVLHVATHGFVLGGACESALDSTRGIGGLAEIAPKRADTPPPVAGENPLRLSGLALAGANHRSAAGEGEDDGILTAEEIASLDLSGVEWAVLSACETGVGDVRSGEGVFGLRRAFQVAGAGTLIMSLWSVDDESTRAWMKSLYEERLEKHLDTAEAVRKASLLVLAERRGKKQSTHPFYWGAFVAAGDWR